MFNYINQDLVTYNTFSVGGCKDYIYLARIEDADKIILNNDDEVEQTIFNSTSGRYYKYSVFNLNYSVDLERSRHGDLYSISVKFIIKNINKTNTDLFERVKNTNMIAIVDDKNGNRWMIGESQPLKVKAANYNSDSNTYQIELITKQKYKIYPVYSQVQPTLNVDINDYVFSDYVDLDYVG